MTRPTTQNQPIFTHAVGRRKSARAQVRITPGNGQFIINGEKVIPLSQWLRPLQLVDKAEAFDTSVLVRGGGMSSRSDALVLGIARALVKLEPSFKTTLRKAGFISVDGRVKERKKPGLKRARKAPQWSKR